MPPSNPSQTTVIADRRVVVVLGMHRSGTSLVAGCLQQIGVNFGPRLMPPNADNPRGYFEHNDVVNLHDRLLLALNRSWDETAPFPPEWWHDERLRSYRVELLGILRRDFPVAPLWGLKDPRLCLLLPWWETIWPETNSRPLFILVHRKPAEVAASLARREGMSNAKSYRLWLRHALEAERWTRSHDRVLVDFGDFLADEATALAPICHRLGLPEIATRDRTRMADRNLGRTGETSCSQPPSIVAEAEHALMLGLAGNDPAMFSELDRLDRQSSESETMPDQPPLEVIRDLQRQLEASRKQARWYEAEWQKSNARAVVYKEKTQVKTRPRGS